MLNIAFAFVLALVTPAFAQPTDSRLAPPPAKSDNRPVQHGAQPNPEEFVRAARRATRWSPFSRSLAW